MAHKLVCTSCGYVGRPRRVTRGRLSVEILLWLCLIVPGVIYTLWRLSTRHDECPSCGHKAMIPARIPLGQKLILSKKRDTATAVQGDGGE